MQGHLAGSHTALTDILDVNAGSRAAIIDIHEVRADSHTALTDIYEPITRCTQAAAQH
jgi:hypothetical protein